MSVNGQVPGKKLRSEIERRTRDTAKIIELETQKLAVGEMVLERLDAILDLLRAAGFKVVSVTVGKPAPPPPHTVVVQASALPPEEPKQIKNPCAACGQEAAFDEPMPDGTKKYYCRPHGQARMKEKAEEQQTAALMGSTGTMFQRPKQAAPPAQKVIIQTPPSPQPQPDPLKGPFPTNGPSAGRDTGPPPPNNVLDD
jgi:hypothetical protein